MTFDLPGIFSSLPLCYVIIPSKKKVKRSDIYAPYGGIFSVQNRRETRGVDTRVKKRKKTTKPTDNSNSTVRDRSLTAKAWVKTKGKNIEHFLNQVSILLSLEDHHIHMMLFGDNIKIAGCRSDEDMKISISILYEQYLKPLSTLKEKPLFSLKTGHDHPRFVFDTVMRNVDFSLGFDIDREKVNDLFNQKALEKSLQAELLGSPISFKTHSQGHSQGQSKHKEAVAHPDGTVFLSQFETTEQKSVNMKMYTNKPTGFTYHCYSPEENPPFRQVKDSFHKESLCQLYNSFLIFSSSKVILSGKYDEDMRKSFDFFVETMVNNREKIEEKIYPVTKEEKDEFLSILGPSVKI